MEICISSFCMRGFFLPIIISLPLSPSHSHTLFLVIFIYHLLSHGSAAVWHSPFILLNVYIRSFYLHFKLNCNILEQSFFRWFDQIKHSFNQFMLLVEREFVFDVIVFSQLDTHSTLCMYLCVCEWVMGVFVLYNAISRKHDADDNFSIPIYISIRKGLSGHCVCVLSGERYFNFV